MCGIAALVGPIGLQTASLVTQMIATVQHRGPDGIGSISFEGTHEKDYAKNPMGSMSLGHVRLSLVDLTDAGHQPMTDKLNRFWMTFNGEIYNHFELRNELKSLGHTFSSSSDSEVLLYAYIQWGQDCLHRLNGIFAFVIFDTLTGKTFAARDRFGVKPLYYWFGSRGHFAIASEIKQFTVLPGWSATLNSARAYDFLNWNIIDHTSETLFQGVMQLRGGEQLQANIAELRNGKVKVSSWYTLTPDASAAALNEQDASRRFYELFEESISLQLRADVPVGSCLSGGLDSSSIVCTVNELLKKANHDFQQHTFSARSSESAYDEGYYIHQVVAHAAVCAHEVTPNLDDLFKLLPQITWHQDEPFGSTSIYAQWHVFALARRQNIKVLLDGQGADEILAGYHAFFGARMFNLIKKGELFALISEMRNLKRLHHYPYQFGLLRIADALLTDKIRQHVRHLSGYPTAHDNRWLNFQRLGCQAIDPFVSLGARQVTVNQLSKAQVISTNLPMLLHCEDRNSMAHGIEARVPFLDHRLVEFALGVSEEHKISNGITKRILRNAMVGIIPQTVGNRMDKLGFVTPEEVWMRKNDPHLFSTHLNKAIEATKGVVLHHAANDFKKMLDGGMPFSHQWWRIISFGAWMERFGVTVN